MNTRKGVFLKSIKIQIISNPINYDRSMVFHSFNHLAMYTISIHQRTSSDLIFFSVYPLIIIQVFFSLVGSHRPSSKFNGTGEFTKLLNENWVLVNANGDKSSWISHRTTEEENYDFIKEIENLS